MTLIPNRTSLTALALAAALFAPAAVQADVFGWRTEDGVFAYTDDRDKIPARYADEAVVVRDTGLRSYPRLTREDSETTRVVAERLQKRLDYLRQVNAPTVVEAPAAAAAPAAAGRTTVTVATGDPRVPTLDVHTDDSAGPVIVEPLLTRYSDQARTRRTTVVKQGDRTLALVKGRSHHYDVNEDIHDEAALEQGR